MKALSQFESFLESLVEGSFRRLFRGRVEPVDLARRLGRVMDDNKRITWDRPLVPNRYEIALAPGDFTEVGGFVDSLMRELEKFASERATERGYSMIAPAEVVIVSSAAVQPASFQVRATVVDVVAVKPVDAASAEPEEFGQTRAMRPLEMPVGPTGFETVYLAGDLGGEGFRWPIAGSRVSIGRGLDNDIVLDDASVSRHHAAITREGGRVQVRDLGSTNGTWVNAARITVAEVHPGDQLAFGAVQTELVRRPPAD